MKIGQKYFIIFFAGVSAFLILILLAVGIYGYYKKEGFEKVSLEKQKSLKEKQVILVEEQFLNDKELKKNIYRIDSNGNKHLFYTVVGDKKYSEVGYTLRREIFVYDGYDRKHTIFLDDNGNEITDNLPQKLRESPHMLLSADNTWLVGVITYVNSGITIENLKTGEIKTFEFDELPISFPGPKIRGWGAKENRFYVTNSCFQRCGKAEVVRISLPDKKIVKLNSVESANTLLHDLYIFPDLDKAFGIAGKLEYGFNDFLPPHQLILFDLLNDTYSIIYQGPPNRIIRNIMVSLDGKKLFFNENEYGTESEYTTSRDPSIIQDCPGLLLDQLSDRNINLKQSIKMLFLETKEVIDLETV